MGTAKYKQFWMEHDYPSSPIPDFKYSKCNVLLLPEREFQPGNQVSLSGTAIKQNGQNINGIANINIISEIQVSIRVLAPVTNGNFYFNLTLPQNAAAGQYLVNIVASELDSSGNILNTGYTAFNMLLIKCQQL